jgi:group I intron endonuclease
MQQEPKTLSGIMTQMIIYKFTHKATGRVYVGKTKHVVNVRVSQHLQDAEKKPKTYFLRALRSHGIDAFSIEVIDYADSLTELNAKECYWIKTLDCMFPVGLISRQEETGTAKGSKA